MHCSLPFNLTAFNRPFGIENVDLEETVVLSDSPSVSVTLNPVDSICLRDTLTPSIEVGFLDALGIGEYFSSRMVLKSGVSDPMNNVGITLKLDKNGDLFFSKMHRLEMIANSEKISQDLYVILRSIKKSSPFNTRFGADWEGIIKNNNQNLIRSVIREALENYEHIKAIESIEVNPTEDRLVEISLVVISEDDERISIGMAV